MSGMAGDNRSSYEEEATDPITPTLHNPSQSYADHTKESASSVAEKIAEAMQPGDNKSTTRLLSDTPTGMRAGEWDASVGGGDRRRDREKEEEGTGVLQAAQEAVAKALGGGSRVEMIRFGYGFSGDADRGV
ncbi:hypothetical protein IFM61606_06874 [Aspergillus udagawae]|uniref:Uncharacterized protein n=1 Tax=Aspergillus udagawae TaxID=91492 RepID=A0ABQ1AI48_9EURO|nr:hypothetical protein IFM51744_03142 [Aspergillus udagawae]GFF82338.1 hypothetical protein IFM53868_03439 [Aspergillus udagawae]GFG18743.1 hypothetical protein IFM5058_09316 [Aspergillus udagawae]GFG26870.1 hypothetical protein IFM61606_06874 [Aspergillus udagawae]